jgi:hypothetical protein
MLRNCRNVVASRVCGWFLHPELYEHVCVSLSLSLSPISLFSLFSLALPYRAGMEQGSDSEDGQRRVENDAQGQQDRAAEDGDAHHEEDEDDDEDDDDDVELLEEEIVEEGEGDAGECAAARIPLGALAFVARPGPWLAGEGAEEEGEGAAGDHRVRALAYTQRGGLPACRPASRLRLRRRPAARSISLATAAQTPMSWSWTHRRTTPSARSARLACPPSAPAPNSPLGWAHPSCSSVHRRVALPDL